MAKYITKREMQRKRAWYRIMASLMDFFGSVGSFIVILICVALITTILAWLRTDIPQTLSTVINTINESIVSPN